MVCPVCFAHCDVDNGQSFGMYFRDVDETFARLPCSAMEQFPEKFAGGFLNFRAHGRRYKVDVYIGHNNTRIGGNDLRKFTKDFKLGHGELVVFMMTGRIAKAFVCYLGGGFFVEDEVEAGEGVAFNHHEEEGEQGDAAQVDEGGNNAQNVEEAPPGIIYSRDVNLVEEEANRLGMLIAIDEGYIGSRFVHRLTNTNITNKLMKIPNKVRQLLNIGEAGFIGVRLGEGPLSRVAYKTNQHGRMVFNKEWGVFATTTNLQAGSAALFTF